MEAAVAILAQHEQRGGRFRLVARLAYPAPVALPVIRGHHLGRLLRQAQAERVRTSVALGAGDELRRGASTALEQCLGAHAAQGLYGEAQPHLPQPLARRLACFL